MVRDAGRERDVSPRYNREDAVLRLALRASVLVGERSRQWPVG